MLKNLTLKKASRKILKTTKKSFDFTNRTAIIGENGTGKTTILSLIERAFEGSKVCNGVVTHTSIYPFEVELTFDKPTRVIRFDISEIMDSKSVDWNYQSGKFGFDTLNFLFDNPSSSERIAHYFRRWLEYNYTEITSVEDVIILIDEPETHNSFDTQQIIIKALEKWCPNVQVIFATHSPTFIVWADSVIEIKRGHKKKIKEQWLKILEEL